MLVKNREDYYSQPYVLYNLVEQLKYRYLSSIKKKNGKNVLSRYYLGYSIDLLKQSLEKLGVLKDITTKLYFDLSIWKNDDGNTPMITFDTKERKKDKDWFNKEYLKYFKGYDFGIDVDAKDINKAYKDTKEIKVLFDKYKLPYSIKMSGSKGFHLLIENKWFDGRIKAKNKVLLCKKLSKVIMNVCRLKSITEGGTFDDTIYDDRRIFKLAYSLQNKNGKEYCCLPLDDYQFENWKLEEMELENVMKKVKLFKRGLLTRTYGLSDKQLRNNLRKFIKECK